MAESFTSLVPNSNLYTYEYFLQSDVCRLCWQRNSSEEFANNTVFLNGIKIEALAVIRECLDLDLCDIGYPNKVCDRCWETVKKFYIFRQFCKDADSKLRLIITPIEKVKTEVKNEISPDLLDTKDVVNLRNKTHKTRVVKSNNIFGNKDIPNLKNKTLKEKVVKSNDKPKKSVNYCYICCTEFDNLKKFTEHNFEYHGIDNGMYKCFGCDKKFKNTRARTSHETNFCKALKEGYKCLICNRFLPLRKLYEAHMRYHAGKDSDVGLEESENIFKCTKCDASFKTKDNLKEHMTSHNSVDNYFVCETCGHVFQRQDYLQKHLMIHQGVKRHICTYCGLRFVQKSSLNVHLRKHTGERPYKCDVCPQRCVSSSNLRAHRRRHLGIKQFECAICGKKFGYKLSLAEHITSAHAPAQSHQCALCGALYTRRKGLQRHAARKHPAARDPGATPEYQQQLVPQSIN